MEKPVSQLPSLKSLRVFEEVAQSGNVARAAEKLNITPLGGEPPAGETGKRAGLDSVSPLGERGSVNPGGRALFSGDSAADPQPDAGDSAAAQ